MFWIEEKAVLATEITRAFHSFVSKLFKIIRKDAKTCELRILWFLIMMAQLYPQISFYISASKFSIKK